MARARTSKAPSTSSQPPQRAFASRAHIAALERIFERVGRGDRLIVATGSPGSGKTTLALALRQQANDHLFVTTIFDPRLSPTQLLTRVLQDWGAISERDVARCPDRESLVATTRRFLASLVSLGSTAVVVIDDAEQMVAETLEHLDVLLQATESEMPLPLRVVLLGRAPLEGIVKRSGLKPLAGDAQSHLRLVGLAPDEIVPYVLHVRRSRKTGDAGREREIVARLDSAEVARIFDQTAGIPALVDDRVARLLDSSTEPTRHLTPAVGAREATGWRRLVVPAMAAAAIAVAASLWLWSIRPSASSGAAKSGNPGASTPVASTPPALTPPAASAARPQLEQAQPAPSVSPSAHPSDATSGTESGATAAAGRSEPPASTTATAASDHSPADGTVGTTGRATGDRSYRITVASFRVPENAAEAVAALAALKIAPEIVVVTEDRWHRVVAGPFATIEDATTAQQSLARAGYANTLINEGARR